MQYKDYYATLGVERGADPAQIKRAYRKLARKYHPDVSSEKDAEARFKEVAEASEVLQDPEKRAAYDEVGRRWQQGQQGQAGQAGPQGGPPPGWDSGFEFSGRDFEHPRDTEYSDFFETLFGRQAHRARHARPGMHAHGEDRHAKVVIDLEDAYRGAQRSVLLQVPVIDAQGQVTLQERRLDVNIPKGIREGQHLRLAGQGGPGLGDGPAGDLYLEIGFRPHPRFRVDGRDVYVDLPVTPWEAALGASVTAATPDGKVQLTIPPDSAAGRKLRLKGKGLPGQPSGDLYAVLTIALPSADTPAAQEAYRAMAKAFHFNPRS